MKLEEVPGPIPESQMAREIIKAHPEKLVKVLIHGRERIGKSIWAINVLWEVYEALQDLDEVKSHPVFERDTSEEKISIPDLVKTTDPEDEAYKRTFSQLYFKPELFLDAVDITESYIIEKGFDAQVPGMILDDAGIGLGGGLYDYDRNTYWELRETWPTIGTYVTGLFLTTPEPEDITDQFKGWSYRVKILEEPTMGEKYGRRAAVYKEDTDVIGVHRRARREGGWKEDFSCFLPDKWFQPYFRKRANFRKEVKEAREKRKEEKEKEHLKSDVEEA